MAAKLGDSEITLMDILWHEGEMPAKRLSDILLERMGWKMSTTYTLIKRCIEKGAIERVEPGFICRPLISKEQVQAYETTALLDKLFDSSADKLFAAIVSSKALSPEEIKRLKQIVSELE